VKRLALAMRFYVRLLGRKNTDEISPFIGRLVKPLNRRQENARRACHGRREQGGAPGGALQARSIITMNGTRKRRK